MDFLFVVRRRLEELGLDQRDLANRTEVTPSACPWKAARGSGGPADRVVAVSPRQATPRKLNRRMFFALRSILRSPCCRAGRAKVVARWRVSHGISRRSRPLGR